MREPKQSNRNVKAIFRNTRLAIAAIALCGLAACDGVIVASPRPGPPVVLGVPDTCFEIRDPALRATVMTRLEPVFRGPRRGGRRVALREYLRTHRYRVYDCGDLWHVVFVATLSSAEPDYVIFRKDGVVIRQTF
ncbi:hypothetical protein ACFQ3C_16590 [Seohaeicola saemankumensis]|uniref:Lipoprotein n=1 Tax=Seohaeicola saemankumensis TaxID=481181 RepID=A0ABW3TGI8_9RHOB